MARPLVSDELWELIEPLIAKVKRRYGYPSRRRIDERKVLTGILFVSQTGIPCEYLRRRPRALKRSCPGRAIPPRRGALSDGGIAP
jgi:transposase